MQTNTDISAYIFDFGNVIINIDFNLMYGKFGEYLGKDYDSILCGLKKKHFFQKVESDVFTAEKMTEVINRHGVTLSVNQVKEAWNALLLDIPKERITLLENLSKQHSIYLLSNTNLVHIDHIFSNLEKEYDYNPIKKCFEKMYLSYEIGFIKPQREIYEHVLNDISHRPEKCLFFDDLQENLDGAASLGIQTQLVTKEFGIIDYFAEHSFLPNREIDAFE